MNFLSSQAGKKASRSCCSLSRIRSAAGDAAGAAPDAVEAAKSFGEVVHEVSNGKSGKATAKKASDAIQKAASVCGVLATSGALAATVGTGGAAAAAVPAAPAVCGGIAAGAGILGAAMAEEDKGPSMDDVFESMNAGFQKVAAGFASVHHDIGELEASIKKGFKELANKVGKVQDTLNEDRVRSWDESLDKVETWYEKYIEQENFRSEDLSFESMTDMEAQLDAGDFKAVCMSKHACQRNCSCPIALVTRSCTEEAFKTKLRIPCNEMVSLAK